MKKLRYGLIGCGDISRKRVAPAIRDLEICDLVAVNRAHFEHAELFAKEFGARKWYETWQELINDNEIDVVYIATPHNIHKEQTIEAAKTGKHVLCEKPLALNAEDCKQMIEACTENNVKLGVAYYRHYYQSINRIKQIIEKGEIGEVSLIQINAFEQYDFKPDDPKYWYTIGKYSGGGPMMGAGCHRVEVLMNILGAVTDVESKLDCSSGAHELDNYGAAILHFASGALGVLCVSRSVYDSADTVDIYGSEGSIKVPILNEGKMYVRTREGERIEELPPHANFHVPLIEDFTLAVLENREPEVTGEIGLAVQEVLDRIYK